MGAVRPSSLVRTKVPDMSDNYPICFVKFFDQEEHADQFRRGNLYLNRLSYFMSIEAGETDLRADPYEVVTTWHQPGRVWYKIVLDGVGEFEIPKESIIRPSPTWKIADKYKHVFCMYAVTAPVDIGVRGQDGESAGLIHKQLQLGKKAFPQSSFACIVNADKFIERINTELPYQRFKYAYRPVTYYDNQTFHGEFGPDCVPFMKQKRFEQQQEFRIVIDPITHDNNAISIHVGDLSAFVMKMSVDNIDALQVQVHPR
jgi:hypothetical protein